MAGSHCQNDPEKFWARVDKSAGLFGCWPWTGYKDPEGYGHLSYRSQRWLSTRLAWTLYHGEIPKGMEVCHRCDNPPCCNPVHLFLDTHAGNLNDSANKQRMHQVLTWADVQAIRSGFQNGLNKSQIGRQFGVSRTTVRNIINRQIYKNCP